MEYDGLHEGQESINEFKIADANWRDLNPLHADDTSSSFLSSLISSQIIGWSPDYTSLKTSLVDNWVKINDFHYKFSMRDKVYWNPSFNVTERDSNSNPLDISTTPLMFGLKDVEVSNGTNRQVTAKDAVFTYLAYSNPIVSDNPSYFDWISDCYVDPIDPLSFHIEIDGNPDTIEIDHYVDFWQKLDLGILPEFFLNSTDPTISQTSGGVNCTGLYEDILDTDQWLSFSTSAFGCGQYMLNYFVKNSVTVLQASPYWMGIGAIDGTAQDLDILTVKVRVILDSSAALAEFKAGKLDWTSLTAFPDYRKPMQQDTIFTVYSVLNPGFSFLAFNMQRDYIGSSDNNDWVNGTNMWNYTRACAVRKAMCYAIDRDEINQVLHDGEYLVNHQPMPIFCTTTYGVFPIQYEHDLDLAWEWMEAAGYEIPNQTISLFLPSCLSVIIMLIIRKKRTN